MFSDSENVWLVAIFKFGGTSQYAILFVGFWTNYTFLQLDETEIRKISNDKIQFGNNVPLCTSGTCQYVQESWKLLKKSDQKFCLDHLGGGGFSPLGGPLFVSLGGSQQPWVVTRFVFPMWCMGLNKFNLLLLPLPPPKKKIRPTRSYCPPSLKIILIFWKSAP